MGWGTIMERGSIPSCHMPRSTRNIASQPATPIVLENWRKMPKNAMHAMCALWLRPKESSAPGRDDTGSRLGLEEEGEEEGEDKGGSDAAAAAAAAPPTSPFAGVFALPALGEDGAFGRGETTRGNPIDCFRVTSTWSSKPGMSNTTAPRDSSRNPSRASSIPVLP